MVDIISIQRRLFVCVFFFQNYICILDAYLHVKEKLFRSATEIYLLRRR